MAKLYPDMNTIMTSKPLPQPGEKYITEFLERNLDYSFEIYYQPFLNSDKPDIIILRKNYGAIIIEVKDWNLQHYSFDGANFLLKADNTKIRSPFAQVGEYKSNLYNLHAETLLRKKIINKTAYGLISCMVYFHNANYEQVKYFFGSEYYKLTKYCDIVTRDTLSKDNMLKILEKRGMNKKSYYFDDDVYFELKRILNPPYHKYEDGRNFMYTSKQKDLIISKPIQQKIKGVAGSGKTLVLAKRAVNAHIRTGGKILILTYNITLRNYIRDRISDVRENFKWDNFIIINYHQFILNQLNNYNIHYSHYSDFDIMEKEIFSNVNIFAGFDIKDKYDAIFIDEVQDYRKPWLDILKTYFLKPGGEYVVFGDEKQNVYLRETEDKKPKTNIAGAWKIMNESYRLSSKISRLSMQFQKEFFSRKYDIDSIQCINTSFFDNESKIRYSYLDELNYKEICSKVLYLMRKENIHPNDACIVGSKIDTLRNLDFVLRKDFNVMTSVIFESKEEYDKLHKEGRSIEIENIRRSRRYNFQMNSGLLKISTVHSFKGWEINTVLLIIDNDEKIIDELIYTGCTRSIKNLMILNIGNKKYHEFFKGIKNDTLGA